jgi:hypothetical protein
MKRVHSLGALALALAPAVGVGQRPTVVAGSFTPAGQVLYFTDFSQDAVGSFPRGLRHVKGPLEVVDVGGTRMLRSIGPSEFVIPLSSRLPQDFTLEFTLLPRASRAYGGEELTFEGGAVRTSMDDDPGSAWVLWNQVLTRIRGGGADPGQVLLPEDLKGEFAGGQPVAIEAMVSGPSLKVFVNGRQLHNVPQAQFRRAQVLRVTLGGMNDADGAVYLARIRLATGGPMPVAGTPTVAPGPTTVGTNRPPTSGTTAATTPPPAGTIPGTITTAPPSTPPPPGTPVSATQPTATGTPRTGTIVQMTPTTRTFPTPWPAPFNSSSSLPNVPPPAQPPTNTSQQAATGPTPPPPVAGPAYIVVVPVMATAPDGWGVWVAWSSVPNAVSYRVYRGEVGKVAPVPIHLTIPAGDAEAAGGVVAAGASLGVLMDADFTLNSGTQPIYWVDATFADGSISALSPNATFDASSMPLQGLFAALSAPGPQNLKVVIGPPAQVTVPNTPSPVPGRFLTWTWDPRPVVLYAVDVLTPTGLGGLAPIYQETLLAASGPVLPGPTTPLPLLSPYQPRGYAVGPPFTVGWPSGTIVRFCVAPARSSAPLAPGPYTSCLDTQVP